MNIGKVCVDLSDTLTYVHFCLIYLIIESGCIDENENIVNDSCDSTVEQHFTDESGLSADVTCFITEVPLLCLL